MFDFLADAVSGGAVSGVLGLVGGIISKRQELRAIQTQNEHAIKLLEAQSSMAVQQSEMENKTATIKGQLAVEKEEVIAFANGQKPFNNFSENVKSAIRPIILLALGYMCYKNQAAIELLVANGAAFTSAELMELHKVIIISIFSLFSMAVGWYFSQRTTKLTDRLLKI